MGYELVMKDLWELKRRSVGRRWVGVWTPNLPMIMVIRVLNNFKSSVNRFQDRIWKDHLWDNGGDVLEPPCTAV